VVVPERNTGQFYGSYQEIDPLLPAKSPVTEWGLVSLGLQA
jgi:hypothetical protein